MVEIFNQTDQEIEELETVEKVLESAIVKENLGDVSFNLVIVDNDYIHELNRDYRKIDRETDVITFALEDEDSLVLPEDIRVLGDIYISIDKARSQAEEYGHEIKREMAFLVAHSMLHLFGYDHMEDNERAVMEKMQEEILQKLNISR